jgi:hypothetical protein
VMADKRRPVINGRMASVNPHARAKPCKYAARHLDRPREK